MTVTSSMSRSGNGLSLLANKCAANTFDISSGMVYASMRDQIVRAQLLITDLYRADPNCKRVLIVGAGIAGVTAAACASGLGLEVVVLESNSKPFALQRGVTQRKVGPFMYEWPSLMSRSQDYPPLHATLARALANTPSWTASHPISADRLVRQLMPWYNKLTKLGPSLRFFCKQPSSTTRQYVEDFVDASSKQGSSGSGATIPLLSLPDKTQFRPDYVVLAVGMGAERVHLIDGTETLTNSVKGMPFWANDNFRLNDPMNWTVGVFGGGDGALQDVLRLLTRFDHPLDFIKALQTKPASIGTKLNNILPELDTIEQQSRLLQTWSADVYDLIDTNCQRIASDLAKDPAVISKVLTLLRPGTGRVIHVHRGQHFTKAYLLNRFCVHLIEICLAHRSPVGFVGYERLRDESAQSAIVLPSNCIEVILLNGRTLILDQVAVRFGTKKDELEKRQLIKLSAETRADRTSMAGIPLPYLVAR
jgi:hypothetical protein